jgi:hypothetical protein
MSCVHHSPKSRQASWCVSSDGSSNSSLAIICVNCNNGPSMCVQKILHSHATPKILAGVWVVTAKILLLRKILGGFLVCDQWLQIFYSYANPRGFLLPWRLAGPLAVAPPTRLILWQIHGKHGDSASSNRTEELWWFLQVLRWVLCLLF